MEVVVADTQKLDEVETLKPVQIDLATENDLQEVKKDEQTLDDVEQDTENAKKCIARGDDSLEPKRRGRRSGMCCFL